MQSFQENQLFFQVLVVLKRLVLLIGRFLAYSARQTDRQRIIAEPLTTHSDAVDVPADNQTYPARGNPLHVSRYSEYNL
ncbi:hypothetical protein GBAR_LOCUS13922 [Geodia barretti]|uniref:Uncharacterized protein n=1 Tax=Geodia barretti TaxID=519541 RepID=A0AA35S5K3_GEOBA|nr:hypothetical protein GBAR_LOCUS13922 [Geodia barretti]